jgi:hypothetical protein
LQEFTLESILREQNEDSEFWCAIYSQPCWPTDQGFEIPGYSYYRHCYLNWEEFGKANHRISKMLLLKIWHLVCSEALLRDQKNFWENMFDCLSQNNPHCMNSWHFVLAKNMYKKKFRETQSKLGSLPFSRNKTKFPSFV